MKKYLLLLLILCSYKLHAQTTITKAISTGFELALPSNGVYNIGIGASVKGELPISMPVSLTLTAGFTSMFYKSNLFNSSRTPGAAVFVPLKAGLKYYFNKGLYAEGEAGTAIETNYAKQSPFAFSVGPGFIVPAGDKNGIDISFRYENWANQLRQTAIRIAYRFGL
ncbi:MAG: hypothetical protein JWR54_523 [Mucilaginibacter sp.]|nr:hypothetical protein [Mucilaginibacter sp.]